MAGRIGVDVGGTYTDLVYVDDATGVVSIGKVLSTPSAPEVGVEDVVSAVVGRDVLPEAALFLHGTTVGLNALLERKGAVLGLLATRGFRDVLALRRGMRDVLYGLLWKAPPPLVPRRLRLPVTERIRTDGSIETPLDESDVRVALEVFTDEGVECIAVTFINSYANPVHELAAERILRDLDFQGEISLSHQVTGEIREYERTSTTVVDAYVRPTVGTYLARLEQALQNQGFRGKSLVTRSGGGAITFAEGAARPVETVMSGPAAGAVGCAGLCDELGLDSAIGADVGGTSFDTCLISGGRPRIRYEGEIAGVPLQIPWIDIRSIGAGGGSIAYVDAGLLHVGPRSAGASPGPVCYGRGGTEPTVTDAAATLGMLALGQLANEVVLDLDAARRSLELLGEELHREADTTARGVLTIINAQMANAIRSITIEVGEDPRRASLVAFGGAGPLFATLLARELEIKNIVVPNYAGGFSAWGLLSQDLTRSAGRTLVTNLDEAGLDRANGLVLQLSRLLHERSSVETLAGDAVMEVALDLRYAGQEYSLTVPAPTADGVIVATREQLAERFAVAYERTYGHLMQSPVQIVAVRVTSRTALPRARARVFHAAGSTGNGGAPKVDAFSFAQEAWLSFDLVDRASLSPGDRLSGPCILLEETATTYLDAGFDLDVHGSGALLITDRGA